MLARRGALDWIVVVGALASCNAIIGIEKADSSGAGGNGGGGAATTAGFVTSSSATIGSASTTSAIGAGGCGLTCKSEAAADSTASSSVVSSTASSTATASSSSGMCMPTCQSTSVDCAEDCCATQCPGEFDIFLGYALTHCGCGASMPCATDCTNECLGGDDGVMEASACGQCLANLLITFSNECIFNAVAPDCTNNDACKPFADCEENCLD